MAAEFNVTSGAIALWETGSREMSGPALRLLELFERESFDAHERGEASVEHEPSITKSWFGRSIPPAIALLFILLLRQFRVTEDTSPVAKRVRLAVARRFIRSATELRGLAPKVLQLVSYMDFLLPDAERALLTALEGERPSMSALQVDRVVETELGERPTDLFSFWSPRPLGIGSIGQVHDATLPSGERVAVKIQYPEIVRALRTDLTNVKLLEQCTALLFRSQKAGVMFDEVRARFLEECDYALEAKRLARFGELFAARRDLEFPRPFPRYSTARVLTMSRLSGVPFDAFVRNASQETRDRAAAALWTFHFESALVHGLFNTDPHPGNLLFGDDRVKILDFGRVKEFSPAFVHSQRLLYRAILERDRLLFARALVGTGSLADEDRFDFEAAYQSFLYAFLPFLRDEPFAYTPEFIRRMWALLASENPNRHYVSYPADTTFYHQLAFGVSAVLARLGARVAYRRLLLPLLYADYEQTPAPYTAVELGALGLLDAPGVGRSP